MIQKHGYRWCLSAVIAAAALVGCGGPEGSEVTSDTSGFVWTGNKWSSPGAIPVCWVNPTAVTDEVRNVLRWIVEVEYHSKTALRFTRWDTCGSTDVGANVIRVRLETASTTFNEATGAWSHPGGLSQIGSNPAALSGEMSATMWIGAPSRWANIAGLRNFTLSNIMHEFGHAVGMRHEHQRSDRPASMCEKAAGSGDQVAPIGAGGNNVYVGGYDAQSIMNYCRTDALPYLTPGDTASINTLYPDAGTGDVYAAISNGNGAFVGTAEKFHSFFCIGQEVCETGDVNGDGVSDLIAFTRGERGDVYVALGNGHGFHGVGWQWHDWFCVRDEICKVADVNGDGKADLVTFTRGNTGDVYVALSTGSTFVGTAIKWHDWFCIGDEICEVGDINGDRKADLVTFTRGTAGDVYAATSTGSSFVGTAVKWHDWFCAYQEVCKVADVNGDGRADLVTFTRGNTGDVYVATSNGVNAFIGTGVKWHDWFCIGDEICEVGDINGDAKADLVTFTRGNTGDVYAALSTGGGFNGTAWKWHDWFCIGDEICKVADINGDRRADLVTFVRH